MNTDDSKEIFIQYWWEKAQESLASAHREFSASSYMFAMNRIYYAAFYAVSAALFSRGISFKKHIAVRSAFHSEFVKSGKLSANWGKYYDQLFRDRQEGDYIPLVDFNELYVSTQLKRGEQFPATIEPLIKDYLES
jgi:uncharacterized protein